MHITPYLTCKDGDSVFYNDKHEKVPSKDKFSSIVSPAKLLTNINNQAQFTLTSAPRRKKSLRK